MEDCLKCSSNTCSGKKRALKQIAEEKTVPNPSHANRITSVKQLVYGRIYLVHDIIFDEIKRILYLGESKEDKQTFICYEVDNQGAVLHNKRYEFYYSSVGIKEYPYFDIPKYYITEVEEDNATQKLWSHHVFQVIMGIPSIPKIITHESQLVPGRKYKIHNADWCESDRDHHFIYLCPDTTAGWFKCLYAINGKYYNVISSMQYTSIGVTKEKNNAFITEMEG